MKSMMKKLNKSYLWIIGLIILLVFCIFSVSSLTGDRKQLGLRELSDEDFTIETERMLRKLDQEYLEVKNDPCKLSDIRSEKLLFAIDGCEQILKNWELDSTPEKKLTKIAVKEGLQSLKNGAIEDGFPRMLLAYITEDKNRFGVFWIDSDCNNPEVFIALKEPNGVIFKYLPFKNTNIEKLCWFSYFYLLNGPVSYTNEPGDSKNGLVVFENQHPVEDIWDFPFLIPNGNLEIWIKDDSGNISNKVPLINKEN